MSLAFNGARVQSPSVCPKSLDVEMRLISNVFAVATLTRAIVARAGGVTETVVDGRKTCTVIANGNQTDDVPNILSAAQECGKQGTIVFPEDQNYWIATRLNPVFDDVIIEWHGQWTVSVLFRRV